MGTRKKPAAGQASQSGHRIIRVRTAQRKGDEVPPHQPAGAKANASSRRLSERLKLIAQVTGAVVGQKPLVKQAEEMARCVCSTMGVDGCVIRLLEADELVLLASAGIPKRKLQPRVPTGWGIAGEILSLRRPFFIPNVYTHPATASLIRSLPNYYEFTSYAGAPLIVRDHVIGILGVYLQHEVRHFRDADLAYLQILANNITVAIVNDRLYHEIKGQRDELESQIAQRNQTERALRESEERFQSAFEYAAIGMALVAPDGRWLKVNRAICDIVGYSPEELLSRTFQNITHPDDLEADLAYVRQMLTGQIHTYQLEKRYIHRLGHVVWVMLSVSLLRDNQGNPLYFISQIQDITNRKHAEEALRKSEHLYRTLVETSPEDITLIDLDLSILMVNQRGLTMYGFESVDEVVGKSVFHFIDPKDHERVRVAVQEAIRTGGIRNQEYSLVRRDGSRFPGEINASLVYDDHDQPAGFICVIRDITQRQRLQQQVLSAQKMESIGTLAGGVAHDFGNILAVIMGNVSILQRRRSLPADARELLDDVARAAERGAAFTQQLLTYARGGSSSRGVTDLEEVVTSIVQLLRQTTPKGIQFALRLADGSLKSLADQSQLEQVVMNLCLNAIQSCEPPNQIEIDLARQVLDANAAGALDLDEGNYIYLRVRDHGCGMDHKTLERIFDPFFTTKPMGRGMGLAIVLGIIRSHQGQIRVESTPGQGTTISVWLPAAPAV